jgi:hypothetical protein
MTQAGNLLRAAKALISDPANWTQIGVFVTDDGCMCAQGALNRAFREGDLNGDVSDQAGDFLIATLRKLEGRYFVTAYNDASTTTHTDIMNLFDDAATMADAS